MAATANDRSSSGDSAGERAIVLDAAQSAGSGSFLITRFREFYLQALHLKRMVERGDWTPDGDASVIGADAAAGEDTAMVPAEAMPAVSAPEAGAPAAPSAGDDHGPAGAFGGSVWRELVGLLERQAVGAHRTGGRLGSETYEQARYVMAALGDEIFLHETDWGARESWKANLLEAKLFGSHRAGERIFERIETLVESSDPFYADLVRIYLMALALGFQGKYRDTEYGPEAIAAYREQLFMMITQRRPRVLPQHEKMFPKAYGSTLDQGSEQRLPHLKPWFLVFAGLLVVWVLVSIPLWLDLTGKPFKDLVDRILGS